MNIFITSFILYELLGLWIRISILAAETGKHHTDLTWLNSYHTEVHQVHQVIVTKFSITKLTNQFTGQRVGHSEKHGDSYFRVNPCEVVKKLQELLHDLFFVIVFFFLIVLQGIVITVTNTIDLVLQTIFCMTSLPNSITSNIISRGRRQQSRRRQRCSRRQRQKQVPRAGLGEEDFFC